MLQLQQKGSRGWCPDRAQVLRQLEAAGLVLVWYNTRCTIWRELGLR